MAERERFLVPFGLLQALISGPPGRSFDLDVQLHGEKGGPRKAKMKFTKEDHQFLACEPPRMLDPKTLEAEPGPTPEQWAYAPGVSDQDIDRAMETKRATDSHSPIKLVAEGVMQQREGESK